MRLVIPVSYDTADPAVCFLFLFYGSPADLLTGDVMASVCLLIYALTLLSTIYMQYLHRCFEFDFEFILSWPAMILQYIFSWVVAHV